MYKDAYWKKNLKLDVSEKQNLNIYNLSTKIHGGIRNLEEQQLQEREIKP